MEELDSLAAVQFRHRNRKAHLVVDLQGKELFYFGYRTVTRMDWLIDYFWQCRGQIVGNLYDFRDNLILLIEPGENYVINWIDIFDAKRKPIATVEHQRVYRQSEFEYKKPNGSVVYKIHDSDFTTGCTIYAPDGETIIGKMDPSILLHTLKSVARHAQLKFPAGIDLNTKLGLIATVAFIFQTSKYR